jgi:hypothetical protein
MDMLYGPTRSCALPEGIPNALKDHMTCSYTLWQEFLQDVESILVIKLKRAKEDLNINCT